MPRGLAAQRVKFPQRQFSPGWPALQVFSFVSILTSVFTCVLALLVLAAAVRLRARLREPLRRAPLLDDEAIRAIEMSGSVEIDDEPLDQSEIDDEERRFWEEERWE